ncbi:hypothetical protein N8378_01170 [Candidatus Pelagibacter ubique]|nr:hypothetical protein [Candidatus Pelagibacter ubique]
MKIFQKSILYFFQEKNPNSGYVNIEYVVNDHLNIVYPLTINRNDLRELVSEFKYHPKVYRRILQTVYTFLAIRWPLEIIASSKSVVISIPIDAKEKWIFIPGNHSIRAIELEKNRCFVFLKSGFDKKFIKTDVNIRSKYKWLKTPKVIQQKNSWYEEQRVVGLPLNRLSSIDLKKKVIIGAQNQLSKIYQKTATRINIKDYVPQLCVSILSMLDTSLYELSDREKYIISNFVGKLNLILINSFGDMNIDLAITHGDFQPGNILCTKDDFWIIDWEYSNQRSIFYDALVFDLECRFPLGLGTRLNKKINELASRKDYLKWTGKPLNSNKSYYFFVFFLEDLLLRMDEASTKIIKNKSEVLSNYLTELLMIQKILTKDTNN